MRGLAASKPSCMGSSGASLSGVARLAICGCSLLLLLFVVVVVLELVSIVAATAVFGFGTGTGTGSAPLVGTFGGAVCTDEAVDELDEHAGELNGEPDVRLAPLDCWAVTQLADDDLLV